MTTLVPRSTVVTGRTRERARLLPPVLAVLALAYGALRAYWAVVGLPHFAPLGYDLALVAGWPSVALCGLAAAAALVPDRAPRGLRRVAVATLAATGAALCVSSAFLLLDVVGTVFFGVGVLDDPYAGLSRAAAVTVGVLSGVLAARRLRALRIEAGACPGCGRRTHALAGRPVAKGDRGQVALVAPAWQRAVAWLVPLAVAVRLGAQAVIGFGETPSAYQAESGLVFMGAAVLLAGVLLPMALAHTWGQVWPFWVPFLAGRRIPRWLVLGPAVGVGAGMTAYFGVGLGQMVAATLGGGHVGDGSLADAFFWVAVPAYLSWALGLLVLAAGYAARTRRPCAEAAR